MKNKNQKSKILKSEERFEWKQKYIIMFMTENVRRSKIKPNKIQMIRNKWLIQFGIEVRQPFTGDTEVH